jgi:hypothetical protein
MRIFPDLDGRAGVSCERFVPRPDQWVAPDGSQPEAVADCSYAAVPGGHVYFQRWSDVAVTGSWVEAVRSQYPAVPDLGPTRFINGEVEESRFAGIAGSEGPSRVQIIACYSRLPYCVAIAAPNVDTAGDLWWIWVRSASNQ